MIVKYRNEIVDEKRIKPIDDVVKRVVSKGKYMIRESYATLVLIPREQEQLDLFNFQNKSETNNDFDYEINEKMFSTCWTNKYDELLEHEKILKIKETKNEIYSE